MVKNLLHRRGDGDRYVNNGAECAHDYYRCSNFDKVHTNIKRIYRNNFINFFFTKYLDHGTLCNKINNAVTVLLFNSLMKKRLIQEIMALAIIAKTIVSACASVIKNTVIKMITKLRNREIKDLIPFPPPMIAININKITARILITFMI